MAQVFLTGGSGFIGRRLVKRLVGDGHTVKALVRSKEGATAVSALGAVAVYGDLVDEETYTKDVKGSEVLFHLAAETDVDAPFERHQEVTVGGTRAALAAARAGGVTSFVLCGSEAALLAGDPLVEVDESAPLQPDSDAAYCAVKARSEKLVLDANADGFRTVSIRPRFVWGPDSFLVEGLAEAARSGNFGWINGGHRTTDVTYVDNAVHGLVLGWLKGRPGQAYFVTDQHRVTLREFLEAQFEVYGVTESVAELDEAAVQAIPVPARWFFGQECTLRTEKASADLGYEPLVDHDGGFQALRESVAARR